MALKLTKTSEPVVRTASLQEMVPASSLSGSGLHAHLRDVEGMWNEVDQAGSSLASLQRKMNDSRLHTSVSSSAASRPGISQRKRIRIDLEGKALQGKTRKVRLLRDHSDTESEGGKRRVTFHEKVSHAAAQDLDHRVMERSPRPLQEAPTPHFRGQSEGNNVNNNSNRDDDDDTVASESIDSTSERETNIRVLNPDRMAELVTGSDVRSDRNDLQRQLETRAARRTVDVTVPKAPQRSDARGVEGHSEGGEVSSPSNSLATTLSEDTSTRRTLRDLNRDEVMLAKLKKVVERQRKDASLSSAISDVSSLPHARHPHGDQDPVQSRHYSIYEDGESGSQVLTRKVGQGPSSKPYKGFSTPTKPKRAPIYGVLKERKGAAESKGKLGDGQGAPSKAKPKGSSINPYSWRQGQKLIEKKLGPRQQTSTAKSSAAAKPDSARRSDEPPAKKGRAGGTTPRREEPNSAVSSSTDVTPRGAAGDKDGAGDGRGDESTSIVPPAALEVLEALKSDSEDDSDTDTTTPDTARSDDKATSGTQSKLGGAKSSRIIAVQTSHPSDGPKRQPKPRSSVVGDRKGKEATVRPPPMRVERSEGDAKAVKEYMRKKKLDRLRQEKEAKQKLEREEEEKRKKLSQLYSKQKQAFSGPGRGPTTRLAAIDTTFTAAARRLEARFPITLPRPRSMGIHSDDSALLTSSAAEDDDDTIGDEDADTTLTQSIPTATADTDKSLGDLTKKRDTDTAAGYTTDDMGELLEDKKLRELMAKYKPGGHETGGRRVEPAAPGVAPRSFPLPTPASLGDGDGGEGSEGIMPGRLTHLHDFARSLRGVSGSPDPAPMMRDGGAEHSSMRRTVSGASLASSLPMGVGSQEYLALPPYRDTDYLQQLRTNDRMAAIFGASQALQKKITDATKAIPTSHRNLLGDSDEEPVSDPVLRSPPRERGWMDTQDSDEDEDNEDPAGKYLPRNQALTSTELNALQGKLPGTDMRSRLTYPGLSDVTTSSVDDYQHQILESSGLDNPTDTDSTLTEEASIDSLDVKIKAALHIRDYCARGDSRRIPDSTEAYASTITPRAAANIARMANMGKGLSLSPRSQNRRVYEPQDDPDSGINKYMKKLQEDRANIYRQGSKSSPSRPPVIGKSASDVPITRGGLVSADSSMDCTRAAVGPTVAAERMRTGSKELLSLSVDSSIVSSPDDHKSYSSFQSSDHTVTEASKRSAGVTTGTAASRARQVTNRNRSTTPSRTSSRPGSRAVSRTSGADKSEGNVPSPRSSRDGSTPISQCTADRDGQKSSSSRASGAHSPSLRPSSRASSGRRAGSSPAFGSTRGRSPSPTTSSITTGSKRPSGKRVASPSFLSSGKDSKRSPNLSEDGDSRRSPLSVGGRKSPSVGRRAAAGRKSQSGGSSGRMGRTAGSRGSAGSKDRQAVGDMSSPTSDVSSLTEDSPLDKHKQTGPASSVSARGVRLGAGLGCRPPHSENLRMSPAALGLRATAELNLLAGTEESLQQLAEVERAHSTALAQQETVALAQVLKGRQQQYQTELSGVQRKSKEDSADTRSNMAAMKGEYEREARESSIRQAEAQAEAARVNQSLAQKMIECQEATTKLTGQVAKDLAEAKRALSGKEEGLQMEEIKAISSETASAAATAAVTAALDEQRKQQAEFWKMARVHTGNRSSRPTSHDSTDGAAPTPRTASHHTRGKSGRRASPSQTSRSVTDEGDFSTSFNSSASTNTSFQSASPSVSTKRTSSPTPPSSQRKGHYKDDDDEGDKVSSDGSGIRTDDAIRRADGRSDASSSSIATEPEAMLDGQRGTEVHQDDSANGSTSSIHSESDSMTATATPSTATSISESPRDRDPHRSQTESSIKSRTQLDDNDDDELTPRPGDSTFTSGQTTQGGKLAGKVSERQEKERSGDGRPSEGGSRGRTTHPAAAGEKSLIFTSDSELPLRFTEIVRPSLFRGPSELIQFVRNMVSQYMTTEKGRISQRAKMSKLNLRGKKDQYHATLDLLTAERDKQMAAGVPGEGARIEQKLRALSKEYNSAKVHMNRSHEESKAKSNRLLTHYEQLLTVCNDTISDSQKYDTLQKIEDIFFNQYGKAAIGARDISSSSALASSSESVSGVSSAGQPEPALPSAAVFSSQSPTGGPRAATGSTASPSPAKARPPKELEKLSKLSGSKYLTVREQRLREHRRSFSDTSMSETGANVSPPLSPVKRTMTPGSGGGPPRISPSDPSGAVSTGGSTRSQQGTGGKGVGQARGGRGRLLSPRRFDWESDDSVNVSDHQSDSEVEGRVHALKELLHERERQAAALQSQIKRRRHRELVKQEEKLLSQLDFWNSKITELEAEGTHIDEEIQSGQPMVKPQIKQPKHSVPSPLPSPGAPSVSTSQSHQQSPTPSTTTESSKSVLSKASIASPSSPIHRLTDTPSATATSTPAHARLSSETKQNIGSTSGNERRSTEDRWRRDESTVGLSVSQSYSESFDRRSYTESYDRYSDEGGQDGRKEEVGGKHSDSGSVPEEIGINESINEDISEGEGILKSERSVMKLNISDSEASDIASAVFTSAKSQKSLANVTSPRASSVSEDSRRSSLASQRSDEHETVAGVRVDKDIVKNEKGDRRDISRTSSQSSVRSVVESVAMSESVLSIKDSEKSLMKLDLDEDSREKDSEKIDSEKIDSEKKVDSTSASSLRENLADDNRLPPLSDKGDKREEENLGSIGRRTETPLAASIEKVDDPTVSHKDDDSFIRESLDDTHERSKSFNESRTESKSFDDESSRSSYTRSDSSRRKDSHNESDSDTTSRTSYTTTQSEASTRTKSRSDRHGDGTRSRSEASTVVEGDVSEKKVAEISSKDVAGEEKFDMKNPIRKVISPSSSATESMISEDLGSFVEDVADQGGESKTAEQDADVTGTFSMLDLTMDDMPVGESGAGLSTQRKSSEESVLSGIVRAVPAIGVSDDSSVSQSEKEDDKGAVGESMVSKAEEEAGVALDDHREIDDDGDNDDDDGEEQEGTPRGLVDEDMLKSLLGDSLDMINKRNSNQLPALSTLTEQDSKDPTSEKSAGKVSARFDEESTSTAATTLKLAPKLAKKTLPEDGGSERISAVPSSSASIPSTGGNSSAVDSVEFSEGEAERRAQLEASFQPSMSLTTPSAIQSWLSSVEQQTTAGIQPADDRLPEDCISEGGAGESFLETKAIAEDDSLFAALAPADSFERSTTETKPGVREGGTVRHAGKAKMASDLVDSLISSVVDDMIRLKKEKKAAMGDEGSNKAAPVSKESITTPEVSTLPKVVKPEDSPMPANPITGPTGGDDKDDGNRGGEAVDSDSDGSSSDRAGFPPPLTSLPDVIALRSPPSLRDTNIDDSSDEETESIQDETTDFLDTFDRLIDSRKKLEEKKSEKAEAVDSSTGVIPPVSPVVAPQTEKSLLGDLPPLSLPSSSFAQPGELTPAPGSPFPSARDQQPINVDDWDTLDRDVTKMFGEDLNWEEDDFGLSLSPRSGDPSNEARGLPQYRNGPRVDVGSLSASSLSFVPAEEEEVAAAVHHATDSFWQKRRNGELWEDCDAPNDFFDSEDSRPDKESVCRRAYKRMLFNFTGEVIRDVYCEENIPSHQPWDRPPRSTRKFLRGVTPPNTVEELKAMVGDTVNKVIKGKSRPDARLKVNGARKKKDRVDAILVKELREEEAAWVDYAQDEKDVKEKLVEDIWLMLIDDTARKINECCESTLRYGPPVSEVV